MVAKSSFPYGSNAGPPTRKSSTRFVGSLYDFPLPTAGVITLPADSTWLVLGPVDLQGNRLVCDGKVTIAGLGQETCSLSSTGLPSGESLVSTIHTLTLRTIALFADSGRQCVEIDGSSWVDPLDRPALDWLLVNFNTDRASGTSGKAAILTDIANSINLVVGVFGDGIYMMGEAQTMGFDNSIFRVDSGKYGLKMEPGSLITSRLRITKSAIIAGPPGAFGLDVPVSSIDLSEGFILEFCSFAGSGTLLDNITKFDDEARWIENRGIANTTRLGEMGWSGNATPTPIAVSGNFYQALGTSVAGLFNQRFSHDPTGVLTYDSALQQLFRVTIKANVTGSNNRQLGLRALLDGAAIGTNVAKTTLNGSGRAENVSFQGVVEMSQLGEITVGITNYTDTTALTVEDLSVLVEPV